MCPLTRQCSATAWPPSFNVPAGATVALSIWVLSNRKALGRPAHGCKAAPTATPNPVGLPPGWGGAVHAARMVAARATVKVLKGVCQACMVCYGGVTDQDSAVKPMRLTMGPQWSYWALISFCMSSMEPPSGSRPNTPKPSATPGCFSALLMAVLAAAITLAGVLAGAKKPNHSSTVSSG